MIAKILEFSKGKKTYAVGVLLVILGVLQQDQKTILEGLGFIFLRQGIGKVNS